MTNKITNEERERIQDRADMLSCFFNATDIVTDLIQNFDISKDRAIRHTARAIRKLNRPIT